MQGSLKLRRPNAPPMVRLRIDDLHAQLAPLDRYGVSGLSLAVAGGVCALVSGFASATGGTFCCGGD